MENLFVSDTLAAQLRKLGFNDTCVAISNGEKLFYGKFHNKHAYYLPGAAILYQQVLDWFREKHNIEIYCPNYYKHSKEYKPEYECRVNGKQLSHPAQGHALEQVELYPTYYQAVDRAIEEALKLI